MSVLLLLTLAMSVFLNFVLLRWALSERQQRHWQQTQLNRLRQQMLLSTNSGASTGRWLFWLLVLLGSLWLAVNFW